MGSSDFPFRAPNGKASDQEKSQSCSSEQELHVFRGQLVEGNLVIVDGAVDHIGFLLLKENHS